MEFEWDPVKAAANKRKHGIAFEVAESVFYDPLALMEPDHIVDHEERWRAIGLADNFAVLVVAHVHRSSEGTEIIRIISARKATQSERKRYEQ